MCLDRFLVFVLDFLDFLEEAEEDDVDNFIILLEDEEEEGDKFIYYSRKLCPIMCEIGGSWIVLRKRRENGPFPITCPKGRPLWSFLSRYDNILLILYGVFNMTSKRELCSTNGGFSPE